MSTSWRVGSRLIAGMLIARRYCRKVDRRVTVVDLMLLGTILLWALNVTATRYLVTHGFRPLAYASIRYFAATSLFGGFTWQRERSFRIELSDTKLVVVAALLLFLNQLCFVTSVH